MFLFLTPEHLHDKGRRHYAAKSKKQAAKAPRGQSIEKRPEEVKSRGSFGHWEMDSIMGCKPGGIACHLVRKIKQLFHTKSRPGGSGKFPNLIGQTRGVTCAGE